MTRRWSVKWFSSVPLACHYEVTNKFRRRGYTWYELVSELDVSIHKHLTRYVEGNKVKIGDVVFAEPGRFKKEKPMLVITRVISRKPKTPKKDKTMAMSKDRVQFSLGYRYFQNSKIFTVLLQAFGIPQNSVPVPEEDRSLLITCRPSQFARFMIYRNEAGLQNGFKDLHVELIEEPEIPDAYETLADRASMSRDDVKMVVQILGFNAEWLGRRLTGQSSNRSIDVSRNPA